MWRSMFAWLLLLGSTAPAFAQSWVVRDDRNVPLTAAEGQSTVVAPGHKDCVGGRFIASSDFTPSSFTTGLVGWHDLHGPASGTTTMDPMPASLFGKYMMGSSDHDLVSLSNGDVYFLLGAWSKDELTPHPAWWDSAYRLSFGPGARSVLLVWRSTDCGKSFQYVDALKFDPAVIGDGSCALPQNILTHHHNAAASPKLIVGLDGVALAGDHRFRWCDRCQQLFVDTFSGLACPLGGAHRIASSPFNVTTVDVPGESNQSNYRLCSRCGVLFRSGGASACRGQATHDGTGSLTYFVPWGAKPIADASKIQQGWRWCSKCQSMFRGTSRCPVGGQHFAGSADNYQLPLPALNIAGQAGWTQCTKCGGLYRRNTAGNVCPASGKAHVDAGMDIRMLTSAPQGMSGESGWKRCRVCGLLFFGDFENASWCPLPRPHDATGSSVYHLALDDSTPPDGFQSGYRVCSKCGGVFNSNSPGGACPIGVEGDTPIYDMGGSDGQVVKVDPQIDRMVLTFPCVGRFREKTITTEFQLSDTLINRTLIAISEKAAPWTVIGSVPLWAWRMNVTPFSATSFAVVNGETDYYARVDRKTNGAWTFVQSPEAAPNAWGWDIDPKQPPYSDLGGNFLAHTIITRIPGQPDSAVIIPDTIPGKGHGYRIFFEDHVKGTYKEATVPITPASKNANDLAFHLQAIHLGVAGPSQLYWYDFNVAANTITIRARFLLDRGQYTTDFTISQLAGKPRSVDSTPAGYGDYQTADGYIESITAFVYHPMWVEAPNGAVHFGTIVFNPFGAIAPGTVITDP